MTTVAIASFAMSGTALGVLALIVLRIIEPRERRDIAGGLVELAAIAALWGCAWLAGFASDAGRVLSMIALGLTAFVLLARLLIHAVRP